MSITPTQESTFKMYNKYAKGTYHKILHYHLKKIIDSQNIRLRNIRISIGVLSVLLGIGIGVLAGANTEAFINSESASLIFAAFCIAFVHKLKLHKKKQEEERKKELEHKIEELNLPNSLDEVRNFISFLKAALIWQKKLSDRDDVEKSKSKMQNVSEQLKLLLSDYPEFIKTLFDEALKNSILAEFIKTHKIQPIEDMLIQHESIQNKYHMKQEAIQKQMRFHREILEVIDSLNGR